MKYYIQPCNPNELTSLSTTSLCPEDSSDNLKEAITKFNYFMHSNQKYIEWDWTMNHNIKVGDIIFFYFSGDKGFIGCKTQVKIIIKKEKLYSCLEIIKRFLPEQQQKLSRKELHNNGLNSNDTMQGLRILENNKKLKDYILDVTEDEKIFHTEELTPTKGNEGKLLQTYVNRYERDSSLKNVCVNHHGYNCSICGDLLSNKYGEYGKSLIHIHHIEPLGEVREERMINPITDLIPVCPNCHAIIHSKRPAYTVDDVKEMLR